MQWCPDATHTWWEPMRHNSAQHTWCHSAPTVRLLVAQAVSSQAPLHTELNSHHLPNCLQAPFLIIKGMKEKPCNIGPRLPSVKIHWWRNSIRGERTDKKRNHGHAVTAALPVGHQTGPWVGVAGNANGWILHQTSWKSKSRCQKQGKASISPLTPHFLCGGNCSVWKRIQPCEPHPSGN